jgi:transcriptional regulator with XRE-family HTH domain
VRQHQGRPLQTPGETRVSQALRRQREAQGISLRALAHRSGVSQYLLVDFEHSRRIPSAGQYAKLRTVLNLKERPDDSVGLMAEDLTALAACLVWSHGVPLATLAAALDLTLAEVRDGIDLVRGQLEAVGLGVSVDAKRARVRPLSWTRPAIDAASAGSAITAGEMAVLTLLHGNDPDVATVADLELGLGQVVRPILAGLVDRGLVDCVVEGRVSDRRYWITDVGMRSVAAQALAKTVSGTKSGTGATGA